MEKSSVKKVVKRKSPVKSTEEQGIESEQEAQTKDLNFEGIDTLSEEERLKVFEELDELTKEDKNQYEDNKFDVSSAKRGLKFPILFNIGLIVIVGSLTAGVGMFLSQRDLKFIEEGDLTASASNVELAQEIIEQNQEALLNKEEELQSLQQELNGLLSGQANLSQVFDDRVVAFQQGLEEEQQTKLQSLRARLEAENVLEEEIQRRLEAQEQILRKQYDEQMLAFKQEQEQQRVQEEAQISSQISVLQGRFISKQKEFENLEQTLARKEEDLARRNEEIRSQLSDTQSSLSETQSSLSETQTSLQTIKDERDQKNKVFGEFNLYHQNIISLVERRDFTSAKNAIAEAKREIDVSPYRTDVNAKSFIDAYNTYDIMIDTAVNAQKILNNSTGAIVSLQEDNEEVSSQIAQFEQEIAQLQKDNDELSGTRSELQTRNATLRQEYRNLEKQYEDLGEQLQIAKNRAAAGIDETVKIDIISDTLANVRVIAQYLSLKTKGVRDEKVRATIIRLTQQYRVYRTIVNTIAEAIDPTGELTL